VRNFTYYHPSSLGEAHRLALEDGAMLLAGGQTLLRDMKRGMHSPASLVDVSGILSTQIELRDGAVSIGAGATHAAVARSAVLGRHLTVLADLASHIGDPAVRNRGTLGGALAANEPAGDYPAACLALDAVVHTTTRSVAATEFFIGDHDTVLEPGEIVTAVTFPLVLRAAYIKFLNPAARYAMVGVFVALGADGSARVAVTGAHRDGAFRWQDAERALTVGFASERLYELHLSPGGLANDLFATAEYRAHLTGVLARRAVALATAGGSAVVVLSHGSPISR
jgi:carbon-monoxide dehydrogenase medium subunit